MEFQTFKFSFNAMGGDNEVLIFANDEKLAKQGADEIIEEVRRIEKKYSRYLPDSVVSIINSSSGKGPIEVDSETASLLDYADACYRQSGGLFDITNGALRRVWNFSDKQLPKTEQIEVLLPTVGWDKLIWKRPTLNLKISGMELDFGGIGKEYAVDRSVSILINLGLDNFLVNLAGDIRTGGISVQGNAWSVGVTDSRDGVSVVGVIAIQSGAIATSGDYERVIEINGKRYSHILNPKTGWPATGLQSVTIVADSCLVAGSITTTAMLLGSEGEIYLQEMNVPYVLITSDGEVRCSELLKEESNFSRGFSWIPNTKQNLPINPKRMNILSHEI